MKSGYKHKNKRGSKIKVCINCDVKLTGSNWYKCLRDKSNYVCIKCYSEQQREKRTTPENKLDVRKWALKREYNITLEQYDKMFKKQNGLCAICGLPELMKRLAVDHNHKTGKIRGLLCCSCNLTLGRFEKYKEQFSIYLENTDVV